MRVSLLALLLAIVTTSQAANTETLYLSGRGSDDALPWDFYCTGGRNSGVWTKINVPSCWEQQGFGTYDYGVEFKPSKRLPIQLHQPDEKGLYKREFTVPDDWKGRVVRLVFQGVLTDAEVKVNGQWVGPVHQGGFYEFKYDITDKIHFDAPNLLEVTVSKHSANDSVNVAERIGDYWNFGGIFRPVLLEALPAQFVDRVAIDAKADGSFAADVFLGGKTPVGSELRLQLKTFDGKPVGEPVTQPVPEGATQVAIQTQLKDPATWSAETPNLYRAEFTLLAGGDEKAAHSLTQRFGFRTFELRPGDGLYVNNHKVTMKGVCHHSFWPETGRTLSSERLREDIRLLKEANMNAVRLSHYPPDAEFLDLCDEAGLYVIDELSGWQGHYDTPTGRKLVAELIARDVNHPSILFWDNGNEGGDNAELDEEFPKHDPQKRPVLHPWALSFHGMNTFHYREYADTVKYAEGPDIFMPTEFLHGLFDGGHGAGLDDYWKVMDEKPHSAGGFLWVWADEAVARTDENGRLDARRDLAPDGMVGPHGEKEGSFYAVREIWSPVQIPLKTLPADFAGKLPVRNRYDFLNLSSVTFEWRLMQFAPPGAFLGHRKLLAHGRLPGPDVAARTDGSLQIPMPANWRKDADVLYVTAYDSLQREIWTWSWQWKEGAAFIKHAVNLKIEEKKPEEKAKGDKEAKKEDKPSEPKKPEEPTKPEEIAKADVTSKADAKMKAEEEKNSEPARKEEEKKANEVRNALTKPGVVKLRQEEPAVVVTVGRDAARFDKATGRLISIERDGRQISLSNGPRLTAYRRVDRMLLPVEGFAAGELTKFDARMEGDAALITAKFDGALHELTWKVTPDGDIALSYEFAGPGVVDLLGLDFDYPEEKMEAKEWLGNGPYRVWQNRLKGGSIGRWDTAFNDPVPGQSWDYPEFKGWFSEWRWMVFTTTEGRFAFINDSGQPYIGVYSPRDGRNNPMLALPRLGLGVYQVIPAIGTKQSEPSKLGPQGQPQDITGPVKGSLIIRLIDQA